jgi:glycosyltransferase involved in cell wall biosynthesis
VTTISESSRREILKFTTCAPAKLRVIPASVSAAFKASPRAFNAESPLILQIGTAPNKNIERLAAALTGISCRLRIVGAPTPPQWAAIRASAVDCTVVERLSDDELLQAYHQADIVAFASTYEGFGLPIVEANAVGRAVVAGNVYSMPEVAGDAACLVDPHDVQSIRDGFLRIIRDHHYREALVRAGYENVARFHRDAVAAQYAEVYAAVAANQRLHDPGEDYQRRSAPVGGA